MQEGLILGLFVLLIGAICGGSFGLPSKFVKEGTPWEVLWGPFFLFVTILIPVTVAPLVVHDLGGVYERVQRADQEKRIELAQRAEQTGRINLIEKTQAHTIVMVLVFGLLWGLGSMTLGMSFSYIGLSLAYALNYGAQIACGFLLPMLLFDAGQLLTPYGYILLAGVAVCLVGVVVSGRAGVLKEQSQKQDTTQDKPQASGGKRPRILIGMTIGFLSGILCACYAVASRYAGAIGVEAELNNPKWAAAWAVTAMILWGGAVSACLYCAVQLTIKRTWGHFFAPGVGLVLLLAATMAALHDAAIFFFGLAWLMLGKLGVPVGYPIFMSFAIIVGNIHGFRSGEWNGASRKSINMIIAGIAILIVGVCIIAAGKSQM